jgi:L-fuculose-phosphate aldolase
MSHEVYEIYPDQCREIVEVCRRLYLRNCLAAADGNVSLRVGDHVLITPSGVSKGFLSPQQMSLMSVQGEVLYGEPSSERLMHLAVYRKCPEAIAVVHAHPPHAIAWSVACSELAELPNRSLSEVILAVGRIPFVPYARPGCEDMGTALKTFLPQHKAMILSRHGALAWGASLEEAWMGMERIEHSAQILHLAKTLGHLSELPEIEYQELQKMRERIGNRCL